MHTFKLIVYFLLIVAGVFLGGLVLNFIFHLVQAYAILILEG
jgi:hypothetical protein